MNAVETEREPTCDVSLLLVSLDASADYRVKNDTVLYEVLLPSDIAFDENVVAVGQRGRHFIQVLSRLCMAAADPF